MVNTQVSNPSIHLRAALLPHAWMDRHQARSKNLRVLRHEYGSVNALAEAVGTEPSYISQLMSERIGRNMGDELARRIEVRLGKPKYWMDQDPEDRMRHQLSDKAIAMAETFDQLSEEEQEALASFLGARHRGGSQRGQ